MSLALIVEMQSCGGPATLPARTRMALSDCAARIGSGAGAAVQAATTPPKKSRESLRIFSSSDALPHIRNEFAQRAAADRLVAQRVDHLDDVTVARAFLPNLVAHQRRVALARLRAAAVRVVDVNPAGAVLVSESVVVNDHKVIGLAGRKAADRRKGDLAREKLLRFRLRLDAGRRLLRRDGTSAQHCAGREEN